MTKELKVIVTVREIVQEPEFEANFTCPNCGQDDWLLVDEENYLEKYVCRKCMSRFLVEIPKYL